MTHYKRKSKIKRQHKDTLFRGVFKIPKHFIYLLEHCRNKHNTLNEEDLTPFDLDSSITTRIRRNDVSYITKDNRLIILIEHQSTINANIAFRLFLYYIELLQLWIKINKINLYGQSKISNLPVPEFYVAYNGNATLKETISTFTLEYTDIKIEMSVNIIDISFDRLTDQTPENALAGYSYFYKIYDAHIKAGATTEEAFIKARETCMAQNYLKEFIDKEGFIVFYKDFLNYDTQLIEEGEARGFSLAQEIIKLLKDNIPIGEIAARFKVPESQVEQFRLILQQ